MQTQSPNVERAREVERESWENEGGRVESFVHPTVETEPALPSEPFLPVSAGNLVLKDLELVRLVDRGALGKYRVQPAGAGELGPRFLVTLFGATCSKVEIRMRRKLARRDYLAAMKNAIEREIGYWQNRGVSLPSSVELTVRDTDFRGSGTNASDLTTRSSPAGNS